MHEPNVPVASWYAAEAARAPVVVGTFHTYSTSGFLNRLAANVFGARRLYSKLSARIAVSEAAQWTAQRYYGGRYRIVPNGVDLSAARPNSAAPARGAEDPVRRPCRGAQGPPVLLRAFEALRGVGVPRGSRSPGPSEEVEPLLLDPEGVEIAGQVDDAEKWRLLGEADLLCAPSLGGESFGMVLTEAFASGTPVVASDIAGYRDVVRDGRDGVLVPAGDAVALGEALLELAFDPDGARRWPTRRASAPSASRGRTWPARWSRSTRRRSASRSPRAGWLARAAPASHPPSPAPRAARSGCPRSPKDPAPAAAAWRGRPARGRGAGAVLGIGLAVLALRRLGIESLGRAIVAATPVWVLVAFALMCASMLCARRGLARDPARRAAGRPRAPPRRREAR